MAALRDTLRNNVKEKLARDEVVASMTVRLCRTMEIAQIARTAGFDTIYVDLEHNMFSFDSTGQICMAALQAGIAPFVRVPSISPEFISRVLDGGALGVIAPHVSRSRRRAQVVRYAKFPPIGERSYGGPLASTGFRTYPVAEANAALNDATMVICMVETVQAVENVDAIAAVEGVDMLFIGTNDLCGTWASRPVRRRARGRRLCAHDRRVPQPRQACRHRRDRLAPGPDRCVRQAGARYISIGSDLGFLIDACIKQAQAMHAFRTS